MRYLSPLKREEELEFINSFIRVYGGDLEWAAEGWKITLKQAEEIIARYKIA